ncbi:hypothetical protein [Micromonospora sp.]|uniref:hypothetical protein n=1 Tax=Micromonospora sp. TaxID=1876 RepID=UPI003B3AB941
MLVPDSVTDAELSTVQLVATAMSRLPTDPACPGPLLVHTDGAFECHGPGCPGGLAIFHGQDDVDPCSRRPEIRTRHGCPRCLTRSDGAALVEHTCTGEQVEHDDCGIDCSAGDACLGTDALHLSGRSCRMFGTCSRNCRSTG